MKKADAIPAFTSEKEEADYWANHELGDKALAQMEAPAEGVLPAPRTAGAVTYGGSVQTFEQGTWLESEEFAYPNGGQTRKGRAIYPDGGKRRVMAGIPDTYFSIPAHGRINGKYAKGYLTVDDGPGSPTRGALLFHVRSGPGATP